MARLTRFLDDTGLPEEWTTLRPPEAGALGVIKTRAKIPELEFAHAQLTRFAWIRHGIEEALIRNETKVGVYVSTDSGPTYGTLRFHLSTPVLPEDVPYAAADKQYYNDFSFLGTAEKMDCPTWDLPAGAPNTGGSCPGATAAQSTTQSVADYAQKNNGRFKFPVIGQEAMPLREWERPGNLLRNTICMSCYAVEGRYPTLSVQIREVVAYWWTRQMIENDPETWIKTMVRAIAAAEFPDTREQFGILPFRIHSAGDFFSPAYAAAWIEVANRVHEQVDPQISFWAPTRTWVTGFGWPELAKKIKYDNMIIRPSAYSIGDYSPGPLYPGGPQGSTSTVLEEIQAALQARKFAWDCPVYEGEKNKKTCSDAPNRATGKIGCRACWVKPNLSINYTTH